LKTTLSSLSLLTVDTCGSASLSPSPAPDHHQPHCQEAEAEEYHRGHPAGGDRDPARVGEWSAGGDLVHHVALSACLRRELVRVAARRRIRPRRRCFGPVLVRGGAYVVGGGIAGEVAIGRGLVVAIKIAFGVREVLFGVWDAIVVVVVVEDIRDAIVVIVEIIVVVDPIVVVVVIVVVVEVEALASYIVVVGIQVMRVVRIIV
jgi:hypothetical protein